MAASQAGPQCLICQAGKYKQFNGSSACANCNANTYSTHLGAISEDTCQACPLNSISDAGSPALVSCNCKAGFTGQNGGPCSACAAGKFKPVPGDAACTDCSAGEYSDSIASLSCKTCPLNSYSAVSSDNLEDCKCNAGWTGPDGGTCSQCIAGTYKPLPGSDACTDCGVGKYSTLLEQTAESTCIGCPTRSSAPAGSDALTDCTCNAGSTGPNGFPCDLCIAGTYKVATGDAVCTNCEEGEFSTEVGATSDVCQTCPVNSNAPPASDALTDCTCNIGSTGPDGTACSLCAAGTYKTAIGSADCTNCATGTYLTSTGATAASQCLGCPTRSSSPEASDALTDCTCVAGSTGDDGTACTQCVAGTYKVETGDAACTNCLEGEFSTEVGATSDVCQTCTDHSNAPEASGAPTDCICNTGYTGSDGGPCASCVAGTYKTSPGSSDCTQCGINTYSTTLAATTSSVCQGCPLNSTTMAVQGSDHIEMCYCDLGFAQSEDHTTCDECNPGFYDDVLLRYICSKCPAGTHSDLPGGVGVEACDDCLAGTWSEPDTPMCNDCPPRSNSPAKSGTLTDCTCNAGSFGADGQTCQLCQTGKYKENTGAEPGCQDCPAGTFSGTLGADSSGTCDACPENSHSPAGVSLITSCICNAGFTGSDGGTCTACVAGKYKIATGDAACTDCLANQFSTEVAATSNVCQTCPANALSPAGSDASTDCLCRLGYTGPNGGTCAQCVAGTYKAVTGDAACTNCVSGFYSTMIGAISDTTCEECPTRSDAPAGSNALTDCTCNAGSTGPDGTACAQCVAGTYKVATGDAVCTNCEEGEYSTAVGAISDVCQTCPANSNAPAASDALNDCTCNAGSTGPDGTACVLCVAGTYKIPTGDALCDRCLEGQYSTEVGATSNTCQDCLPNSNAPSASDAHTDCICDKGWTGPDGSLCSQCETDQYKDTTGSDPCSECPTSSQSPAGSDQNTDCLCNTGYTGANGETCLGCVQGKYKNSIGPALCTNCGSNSISSPASTKVEACLCVEGYTGANGLCSACSPGRFKGSIGPELCLLCATGSYSSAFASVICNDCPDFSNSPEGSSSADQCTCFAGYSNSTQVSIAVLPDTGVSESLF